LTSLGVTATALVPSVVLIRGWFPRRFGTALGVASAGIGVGIFAVVPFCQAMIDTVGWRWAFRILGIVVAVWIVPAAFTLVRDPPALPADERQPSYGRPDGASLTPTLATALAFGSFWLLAVAQFCGNFVCQMLLVHQVAFLVDLRVAPSRQRHGRGRRRLAGRHGLRHDGELHHLVHRGGIRRAAGHRGRVAGTAGALAGEAGRAALTVSGSVFFTPSPHRVA